MRNVAVIMCIRNNLPTLERDIPANRYEGLFGNRVCVFRVDIQGNTPSFRWHPENGPRYEAIADAMRHWTDADVPVGASAAVQPSAPVRPPVQLASVSRPFPRRASQPVGAVHFEISNDDATVPDRLVRDELTRRFVEAGIPIETSRAGNTNLIVFARRQTAVWDEVSVPLRRGILDWEPLRTALVVVYDEGKEIGGDFPPEITSITDLQLNAIVKRPGVWDTESFDIAVEWLEEWIIAGAQSAPTAPDVAPTGDVLSESALVREPDDGRPVVRTATPSPEPDNGRPYVPSPSEPDNGPLATYGDTDSEAELDRLVDEAERLVGALTPPAVPRARPRAASLGSLRASLRPPVVPIPVAPAAPAAPAALAPIAEYDPFDDAYDGGRAAHMHHSALGRALAARLSTE